MKFSHVLTAALTLGVTALSAKENIGQTSSGKTDENRALSADCAPATAQTDLAVNNVRTTILAGGDMWWDLSNGQYEIPKIPEGSTEQPKHSLFAGSLWIGGIDAGGQLKVAAMTYRQTGNDFWPGPLSLDDVDISADECSNWDKHFKMSRADVEEFVAAFETPEDYPSYTVPQSIYDWPAHPMSPSEGQAYYLAPFFDRDGDGTYDPNAGDYPDYDVTGSQGCDATLYGDETLWWVFNDKGNIHTETGAESIGLEIHAQAFGFATNDEINNMTFYQYKIYNRSTFTLTDTYFGQWVDPDLGKYDDDFVGCDVARGLGYCYNGDENDDGASGYGVNPPAVGVDFFQGPVADAGDGIDNDRDGVVDEAGEQIIMSKFVYYNNDFSVTGNPETGTHIYNYLRGIFKDGTSMEYGGTGHSPSGTTLGIGCDFMFPGDSDPDYWGTNGNPVPNWSEVTEGNVPADRRFLQSAGAFTLEPGALNTITTGVVWARATQGGATASIDLMRLADDKAQALFDNCFQVLNGPDAPDMAVQELDQEILLILTNKATSNNYLEEYEEFDPLIIAPEGETYDTTYNFQGYQIYQLKDATVSITDVNNPDLVRLVAQVDIADGVDNLVNFEFDQDLNANVPTLMVEGSDEGIQHSFKVTKDLFAQGDDKLVNHKQYYFTVVAYGYNNYKGYNQNDPNTLDGQKKPYKAGRKNIKTYTATPHDAQVENGGTAIQSSYGLQPKLTHVRGRGNGGMELVLTEETEEAIVSGDNAPLTYENTGGPVNIKVIDPLAVPLGDFRFEMHDTTSINDISDAYWTLTNETTGEVINSDHAISVKNEQIIPEWGFSVDVEQLNYPGEDNDDVNGFISGTITYADNSKPWLSGISDVDGQTYMNWIRSGTTSNGDDFDDQTGVDDQQVYEKVINGTFAPYRVTSSAPYGPAWSKFQTLNKIDSLTSIKLVITSDKSKWTRSVVLELAEETSMAEGGARKLDLRAGNSVDKDGNADGSGTGMGWFPGYAINLETGQRLNIMYGENSFFEGDNGRDMMWNPSSTMFTDLFDPRFGGMHSIYICNAGNNVPAYDQGAYLRSQLDGTPSDAQKRKVFSDVSWVAGFPLLDDRYEFLSTDVEVVLNVNRPYRTSNGAVSGLPEYTFNTEDIMADPNNNEVATDVLDKINIVPNPYYGYSDYESNQLDNRVRLTNLPEICTIKIFSVNGTLIREYDKDEDLTYLDWDLKNQAGIPVASGVYIIHVDVPGVGEKVLKWFGVMRPIDLDTF